MKQMKFLCVTLVCVLSQNNSAAQGSKLTSLAENIEIRSSILPEKHADLIEKQARYEAAVQFGVHRLPDNLKDWEAYKVQLKKKIAEKTGALLKQDLPLNIRETRVTKMQGYTVKNIAFQTRPGIYATANLYIPDGSGPFPAAVLMAGHTLSAKIGYQYLGYTLALNGFVGLTIDPWGAGERATQHGTFEYHGANLGASLMNLGESLMGVQITDNMRAMELLCSLPFVDPERVGATGCSGGGNQTMWLAAMDERVKAAVPVVSVGTFESYVMGHNCICEVLIDGLTFTEESGVLAMVAPRALMLSNGLKDGNTAFYPSEMLRSFANAMPIFEMYGAGNKFSHHIFDGPHGYPPESREAMINFFNAHLKGLPTGRAKITIPENGLHTQEEIMVYPKGERDPETISTAEFCRKRGQELRKVHLEATSFKAARKKKELKEVLRISDIPTLKKTNITPSASGWDAVTLETSDGKLIPLWHRAPKKGVSDYVVLSSPDGAKSCRLSFSNEKKEKDTGVVIVDLSGTGEATSTLSVSNDKLAKLHTLARANLWLGKTVIGEWVKELDVVTQFLLVEQKARKISFDGTRESGLAGLFFATLGGKIDAVTLRDAPVSYIFDDRETIDFFSMGVHLPGILKWGDISLAAALSNKDLTFINPVTMSGQPVSGEVLEKYKSEFKHMKKVCRLKGSISFK
ncbi:MAG: acetylxylan esterase [Kiritimatiellia bacterium]